MQPGPPGAGRLLDRPLDRTRLRMDIEPADFGMAPLSLETLVVGEPSPVDLFLPIYDRQHDRVDMAPACPQGEIFKARWRDRLLEADQRQVFVRLDQSDQVDEYFQRLAGDIMNDPQRPSRNKVLVVQELAALNLNTFFSAGEITPRLLKKTVDKVQQTVQRLAGDPQLLRGLSALLRADYSVYSHSVNVCMLCMALGRFLGQSPAAVQALGVGGLLHDLGRAKLPPALFNKTGPLDPDEQARMRTHPLLGYQMLSQVAAVPHDSLMIVLHHHENADGSGYPHGLKAARTPLPARLARLADTFDAMTSRRPHQDAKSAFDAATAIIQERVGVFGADLVPQFIRFLASPYIATP